MKFRNKALLFVKKQISSLINSISEIKKPGLSLLKNKKLIVTSCAIAIALLFPYLPLTSVTLAYEIKYEGETIGYVANRDILKQAETIASKNVEGEIQKIVKDTEYNITVVANNELDDAKKLSDKILENSDEVEKAFGIYVGSKCIAISDDKALLEQSLHFIKSYYIEQTKSDIAFFDGKVVIKECLSIQSQLNTQAEINSAVKEFVKVKTGIYSEKTKTIKYKTIKVKDNSMYKGTTDQLSKGKNGKADIKVVTYYINGEKDKEETIITNVTTKAVDEKIAVGTKKLPNVKIKDGATYAWPLVKNSSEYVSSGFGMRNGRLHKGIDICANYGTEIIAAMDGTVVRAGRFESYGNCIEIKHADGNMTRYAHCSSISVKVGDKVTIGEIIGKVGSTGRSTGNHLHFEVWEKGSLVNPYSYVGKNN